MVDLTKCQITMANLTNCRSNHIVTPLGQCEHFNQVGPFEKSHYVVMYILIYLPTYLSIYLSTYLLSTYIPTYSLHKQVCTFQNIGKQACVLTYQPSSVPTNLFMKKFEVQLLLYTLIKTFMEVFKNILNVVGII